MDTKPRWNEAPEWAKYLSRDPDGQWAWWENKPEIDLTIKVWFPTTGEWCDASGIDFSYDDDWRDTLEKRPK